MNVLTRFFGFYLINTLVSIEVKCAPSGGSFSSIMEAIEAAAGSISPDSLSLDKILIQWLHRVNAYTTYHDAAKGQNSPALFTRKTIDTDKDILVLGSDEDHLPLTNVKRTFVVLKRHSSGETGDTRNAEYKVFYAYVRDAKEQDPLGVAVGNQRIRVEFDNWDGRGSSTNTARSLGWTTCFESIYPTCKTEFSDAAKGQAKDGPVEVDYSSEQESIGSEIPIKRNRTRVSNIDGGESNYYDLFADLDETQKGREYIRTSVGAITWSISSISVLEPPEKLLEMGIAPKNLSSSPEIQAQVREDATRASQLLQEISPKGVQNEVGQSVQTLGDQEQPAQRLSRSDDDYEDEYEEKEEDVDMGRFNRLKEQYINLIDQLKQLSKLYAKKGAVPVDEKPVSQDKKPKKQLNDYKAKAIRYREIISDKGKPVMNGILEQSEVGQELNDNPEEGQDLLNEIDPDSLLEEDDGLGEDADEAEKKKAAEERDNLEKEIRRLKKQERELKAAADAKKQKAAAEKKKSTSGSKSKKSGLVGGLVGGLLGRRKRAWDESETADEKDTYVGYVKHTLGQFVEKGFLETATEVATDVGMRFLGMDGMMEVAEAGLDAMDVEGGLSKFKLVTGVGGTVIQHGIKKIPVIGQPISYVTGFFGNMAKSMGVAIGAIGRDANGGAQSRSTSDTNLFGHIGWRTADIESEDLHTKSAEIEGDTPFIGFGKCPREIVKFSDFENSNNTGTLIRLYLTVGKTYCSLVESAQIVKLIVTKLLQVEEDKTISLVKDSPLLSKPKLSLYEAYDLSAAVEFSVFTKTLMSEWRNPTAPVGPDDSKITKTVYVFIQSALNAINEANKLSGCHFIKLVRNVVITLKTGFTELLQDYDRYKACSKCPPELIQTSKNDLTAINALMQFIVVGLRPVDQVGQDVKEVFKQFYKNNQPIVDDKVKMFF